jgi:hypothetical protein
LVLQFFIHPAIAIFVVSLTILTFLLKARKRKFFKAHYISGMITVSLAALAIAIAVWAIQPVGFDYFPDPNPIHLIVAIPAALSLFMQGGMGIMMVFYRKSRAKAYPMHRRLARLVVIIVAIQGMLGLMVLYYLYMRYY